MTAEARKQSGLMLPDPHRPRSLGELGDEFPDPGDVTEPSIRSPDADRELGAHPVRRRLVEAHARHGAAVSSNGPHQSQGGVRIGSEVRDQDIGDDATHHLDRLYAIADDADLVCARQRGHDLETAAEHGVMDKDAHPPGVSPTLRVTTDADRENPLMSTGTADRLNQISEELKSILETRLQELAGAMRGTEQATRQIVATEMEIARYNQITSDSRTELATLRKDAEDVRVRAEEAGAHRNSIIAERDASREALTLADREAREAGTQVGDLRARLRGLELEGESLRREAEEISARVKAAEENVARLRRLREELMQQMSALSMSSVKE